MLHGTMLNTSTLPPADPSGGPLRELIYTSIFLSMLSFFACVFVLVVFGLQLYSTRDTVLRNSLNFMWLAAMLCSLLMGIEGVISQSFWVVEGNDVFRSNKTSCVVRGMFFNFFRTCIAGFLFCYYTHIYIVGKYDERKAFKAIPYYVAGTLLLACGIAIFSGIEIPKAFDASQRCVKGDLDSVTANVPILVPVIIELGVVIAGMAGVFHLLCGKSKVNAATPRRQVMAHVAFMFSMFMARATLAGFMLARARHGAAPELISTFPVGLQVIYYTCELHSWLLGFILAVVFSYSECLMYIARRMLTPPKEEEQQRLLMKPSEQSQRSLGGESDTPILNMVRSDPTVDPVEEHLRNSALSCTVQSCSAYADGDEPPNQ